MWLTMVGSDDFGDTDGEIVGSDVVGDFWVGEVVGSEVVGDRVGDTDSPSESPIDHRPDLPSRDPVIRIAN